MECLLLECLLPAMARACHPITGTLLHPPYSPTYGPLPCPPLPPTALSPAAPHPTPAGASKAEVEGSPFVESLVEKGYEVLYMTDPLDEYVMQVS